MSNTRKVKDIDRGWERIKREFKEFNGAATIVGYPEGESGTERHDEAGITLASLAAVHEYGSVARNIPERPFQRDTFEKTKPHIKKVIINEFSKVLKNKQGVKKALSAVGEWYTGEMKTMITKGSFTPLSIKTIAKKGSSTPLIDTGQLRNSITHKEIL